MRGFLSFFSVLVSFLSIALSVVAIVVCLHLFLRLQAYHPPSLSNILVLTDYRTAYFDDPQRRRQLFLQSAPASYFVYHLRYGQLNDLQHALALGLLLNGNYASTSEGVSTALQIAVVHQRSWEIIAFILDSGGVWTVDKPLAYTYRMVDEVAYYTHHPQYPLIHSQLTPLF